MFVFFPLLIVFLNFCSVHSCVPTKSVYFSELSDISSVKFILTSSWPSCLPFICMVSAGKDLMFVLGRQKRLEL